MPNQEISLLPYVYPVFRTAAVLPFFEKHLLAARDVSYLTQLNIVGSATLQPKEPQVLGNHREGPL